MKKQNDFGLIVWVALLIDGIGTIVAASVAPAAVSMSLGAGFILLAAKLIFDNRVALKSRTAAFGAYSLITTLLVTSIVGVLNFLAYRYPAKLDLTQAKVHTLSDQTKKLVANIQQPIHLTVYGKLDDRMKISPLVDNYKSLNPHFEVEYVDPDREPTRAREAGVKTYGAMVLHVGSKDTRIESPDEEKLTNALMKLVKEKAPILCAITGHGERSFEGQTPLGLSSMKKALTDQAYEIKDISLLGAKLEECDSVALLGPTKSLLEPELKALTEYLADGGHAIITLDLNLKGTEFAPELRPLLAAWHIEADQALIVDPLSKLFGVEASVAILTTFSPEHAITRDFPAQAAFPLTRPLSILPGAPAGLNVQWLAETTPKSWAVTDLKTLAKGVSFIPGKSKGGPLPAIISVEGKIRQTAKKASRLVVFGSSEFSSNNFYRLAGNGDLFLNAVSWTMEDDSLISIRARHDEPGKIELSQTAGTLIALASIFVIPASVAIAGIVIWALRRRM